MVDPLEKNKTCIPLCFQYLVLLIVHFLYGFPMMLGRAGNSYEMGMCGFQILDPTVAWILSSVGLTIRRGRGYPYLFARLWSPMFLDYLLSPVVTYCPVTRNHCRKECEARVSHTHSLLSIIVDGGSRGIVRTDPITKPGVSSTLPSKKREMR